MRDWSNAEEPMKTDEADTLHNQPFKTRFCGPSQEAAWDPAKVKSSSCGYTAKETYSKPTKTSIKAVIIASSAFLGQKWSWSEFQCDSGDLQTVRQQNLLDACDREVQLNLSDHVSALEILI